MKTMFKVIVSCYVLSLTIACSDSATDAQYVDRARDYLDRREYSAASIELKNALLQNEQNGEARLLLGKVYVEFGNYAAAQKELRRASALGVVDEAVLPPLARAHLGQGSYEELQALSLDKLATKEQRAIVLTAQGLGSLVQGRENVAEEQIDEAVLLAPEQAYPGVARARLQIANKQTGLARKELDRVFLLDANYALAWNLLGDLEVNDGNLALAEVAYTKAMTNSVNDFPHLIKRAMVRVQQAEYEAAQEDIDELKNRSPRHAGVNFYQGLIYLRQKQWSEARDAFDVTLAANSRHLQAMYFLSLTHLGLGNMNRARDYANQFLAGAPLSVPGRKLMASIELATGEYAAAEEMIQPVADFQVDDIEALNLLASALLNQQKVDEAIELLRKLVDLQPNSAIAQLRLGVGLIAGGKPEQGVEFIEKARVLDPQLTQAEYLLVREYVKQGDLEKALAAANSYRERHPDTAPPLNMIGSLHLELGDDEAAVETFMRALEVAPGDPTASHSLAALAVKNDELTKARALLQEVLSYHENHLATLLKLATLDGWEKNEKAQLLHLQQAVAAHPSDFRPNLILARYYLSHGEPDEVPMLLQELSVQQRRLPAVLEVTGLSQLARHQFLEAKLTLGALVAQQPDSAQNHFLLAQANAGLGDGAAMKEELEATVALAPDHFTARLALARLLLVEGNKEEFTGQLTILSETFPDHPDVLKLRALQARAQGDEELALELLEEVLEKSPDTASMISVARLKWAMGERDKVLELQEKWAKEHPDDQAAALSLAGTYVRKEQFDKAIIQYEEVLEVNEKNVLALNNLAWSLRDEQPEAALEYAERAIALAPESPAVIDTLAVLLMKNGDIVRAKRIHGEALRRQPKNATIRYHAAMIDAAAGNKESAARDLESLLSEKGDFPEKPEAQKLLAELNVDRSIP